MIKLITFDLWNTLISENGTDLTGYRISRISPILARKGIDTDESGMREAFSSAWKMFMYEWESRNYTPTTSSMLSVMFSRLGIEPDRALFREVLHEMETVLLDSPAGLIEGTEDILKELKGSYKTAIISDTGFTPGRHLRQLLKNLGVYHYFNVTAFSDEIGVSKPDRRMFEFVLRECRVEPDEAVHIGDLLRTDIAGAVNAGMKSVHFTKEKFIEEDPAIAEPSFTARTAYEIPGFVNSL